MHVTNENLTSSPPPETGFPAPKPTPETLIEDDDQTVIGINENQSVGDLQCNEASEFLENSLFLECKPVAGPIEGSGFSGIKPAFVGAGLDNLGNTCFMNAILQCFTHTSLLVQGLCPSGRGSSVYNCGNNRFCALCTLREQIDVALSLPGKSMAPIMFADNLKHISSNFERGQQEDAHEFLQCLLDRLEECCLGSKSKEKCSSLDDNLVERVFGGRLKSRLRCSNCGHCSDTPERLIDLSLEIDNADTLVSALDSFTKIERIEDSEQVLTCASCNEKVSMDKQLMLEKAPSVAAVHLKRFKADGFLVEKITKHVDFPLELNLQPYCIGSHDNNDLKYDLYAVVVHEGFSSDLGHYYCYVRSSPDVWYKLNDWKVTRVQETTVLLEEGYMLFYTKQGTPWISDMIDVSKCFDPNSSNTSPDSVLDNRDSACTSYGNLLNCIGVKDYESREYCKEPNYLLSSATKHCDLEVDQTGSLEESKSRQNGDAVTGYSSCTYNDNFLQSGPSNLCSENDHNERKVDVSNKENNCCIEAEDRNEIVQPSTPSTSPYGDKHVVDHPVPYDISRNSMKSEGRVSRKRPENKAWESPEIRSAMRSAKKHMPMSRGSKLIAAIVDSQNEGSSRKGKRPASSPCKKGSSPKARRHKNVLRTLATATLR